MNELQRTLLSIASRLLSYPGDEWDKDLQTIREWTVPLKDGSLRQAMMKVVGVFESMDITQLQELYVATFDWKEPTGLYLTAHELGDSRKRGNALILLQSTLDEAGFAWPENELADYMPMLYEFLAEASEENTPYKKLVRRLACATQHILGHVPDSNLYHGIFAVLMNHVFEVPTEEEMKRLEEQREEADLGEMPYPIQFQ